MTSLGEIVLAIIGLFYGAFWFDFVLLSLCYGFPRALYWRVKGWARRGWGWYLASAGFWAGIVTMIYYLFSWLAPSLFDTVFQSDTFNLCRIGGIAFGLGRQLFSSNARNERRACFIQWMTPYLTETGLTQVSMMGFEPPVGRSEDIEQERKTPLIKNLLSILGGAVIILALLGGWRYLLESTRPPVLKAWEACKTKLLENWARSHTNQVKPLLRFTEDHHYSFGGESPSGSFDDHDSRGTAQTDAQQLGISERELIQLDQRIAKECGPFPKS